MRSESESLNSNHAVQISRSNGGPIRCVLHGRKDNKGGGGSTRGRTPPHVRMCERDACMFGTLPQESRWV